MLSKLKWDIIAIVPVDFLPHLLVRLDFERLGIKSEMVKKHAKILITLCAKGESAFVDLTVAVPKQSEFKVLGTVDRAPNVAPTVESLSISALSGSRPPTSWVSEMQFGPIFADPLGLLTSDVSLAILMEKTRCYHAGASRFNYRALFKSRKNSTAEECTLALLHFSRSKFRKTASSQGRRTHWINKSFHSSRAGRRPSAFIIFSGPFFSLCGGVDNFKAITPRLPHR